MAGIQVFLTVFNGYRAVLTDHDHLLDPGECRAQLPLQALDQGHPGDVSPPAEARWRDLDRAALDAGKGHVAAAGPEPLGPLLDDRPDLLDILLHPPPLS